MIGRIAVAGLLIASMGVAGPTGVSELAKAIGESDRCPGGLQLVIGSAQADLAMALAKTGVFDTQIVVDNLAAFSGKRGGELFVIRAADGTVEQELKIPGEPVFKGIAATPGSLFLTLRTGIVVGLTSVSPVGVGK